MIPRRATAISLPVQLAVLFTLALLPLGLISLYQTWVVTSENQRLANRALLAETQDAAAQQQTVMQEALGAAAALAASLGATDGVGPDNLQICETVLERFVNDSDIAVWAGFVRPDSTVACASDESRPDLTDWDTPILNPKVKTPSFTASRRWPAAQSSVIAATVPIHGPDGFEGVVVVSIPHVVADAVLPSAITDDPAYFVTLNTDGDILTATNGIASAPEILPADIKTNVIARYVDRTFSAQSPDGTDRLYAVSALIPDQVVLVSTLPKSALAGSLSSWQNTLALIFPVLMWIASLGVALFGLHRLVLRHIRALRGAMRRFALGERDKPQLVLEGAPPEFEEAQRAFNRMVVIIGEAEERTKKDLREKTVLLREVHHRVKNNLQMIASIMNLQARKSVSPETRAAIDQLQRRIRGLAMIHRSLYTTPDMTTVNGAALIQEILQDTDVASTIKTYGITLNTDLAPVELYPDQAVPLSMLLAETTANALKYVGRNDAGEAAISIALRHEDGRVKLTIENTRGERAVPLPDAATEAAGGLGNRLIQAFVIQLGGEQEIEETDTCYRYILCFDTAGYAA